MANTWADRSSDYQCIHQCPIGPVHPLLLCRWNTEPAAVVKAITPSTRRNESRHMKYTPPPPPICKTHITGQRNHSDERPLFERDQCSLERVTLSLLRLNYSSHLPSRSAEERRGLWFRCPEEHLIRSFQEHPFTPLSKPICFLPSLCPPTLHLPSDQASAELRRHKAPLQQQRKVKPFSCTCKKCATQSSPQQQEALHRIVSGASFSTIYI